MTNYLHLIKLLLVNKFRRNKDSKGGKYMFIVYIAIAAFYGLIMTGFIFIVVALLPMFMQLGLMNELITMLIVTASVGVLFMGLISMLGYLYFCNDTEFFLALPVRPATIYLAKLTIVYLGELLLSTALILPLLITVGVVASYSWVFYVTTVIIALLLPAFPLLLASILSIPLMYIVSFFKNKGALTSIVLILLFAVFIGGYYLLIGSLVSGGGEIDLEAMILQLQSGLVLFSNIFYPLYSIARFATMTDNLGNLALSMISNFAIFIAAIAALATIAMLISNAVYRKSSSSQLESGKSTSKRAASYKTSSIKKALMLKEWREMVRTPAFAFQCLAAIILCPLLLVFMKIMGGNVSAGMGATGEAAPVILTGIDALLGSMMTVIVSLFMFSFLGVGMNIGASTVITREGASFYYCKMLPVDYKTQIQAKSMVYLMTSMLTLIVSIIVQMFLTGEIWLNIMLLAFLLIYNYGYVNFCVYFDLTKPKLDWVTATEAIKNSRSANMPMLINLVMTVIIITIPVMLLTLISNAIVAIVLVWVFLFAIATAAAIVFRSLLYSNADRLINRIDR